MSDYIHGCHCKEYILNSCLQACDFLFARADAAAKKSWELELLMAGNTGCHSDSAYKYCSSSQALGLDIYVLLVSNEQQLAAISL